MNVKNFNPLNLCKFLKSNKIILIIIQLNKPHTAGMSVEQQSKRTIFSLKSTFLLTFFVIISQSAISTTDTHISTTRNAYRSSICGYFSGSYTSSDIQATQKYITQYSYLTNAEIESILFNQNFASMNTNTILIAAPHMVTFAIFIILWIPLCCCCVWPQKHPTCRKCRKPEKENYGNCQLKWTAYATVIAYLMVAAGGAVAIIQGPNIVLYFNDIGCKITAIGDDIVNGRLSPTVEDRFFAGLSPFSADLTLFKAGFNTIWTQSQNSLSNAGNLRTKQNFYQTQINNTYSSFSNTVYHNAFAVNGSTSAYQDVSSAFKTMYFGPATDSTKILGKMYSTSSIIFNQINNVMDPMISAWTNLSTTTSSGVNTQMTAALTSSATLQTNINDFENKLGKFFNNQSLYAQLILVLKAFYGCFFGLAILGTVSAILLACFSVVRIRLIMYFTCASMYVLSVFGFIFLILLSIMGPNLSQICAYMDTKFTTGAGTYDFFTKMGWSKMGNLTNHCMSDGSGWMMNEIQPTFNASFANLVLITQGVQLLGTLIPDYSTANFTSPISAGAAIVTKVSKAQLLDVNDPVATSFIDGVRLVSYSFQNCTNPTVLQADSWMPSYALYSCPSGKAQNAPCNNLGSTTTCALGCYEIMNQLESAAGDTSYPTTLQTRYGPNCNYYTYVKNMETNWNIFRKNSMTAVQTSLNTLLTDVTNYDNYFKSIQANVTTYATILQTNFDGITNLTSGTFNGMDCRVIGESIIDFRNAVCVGFLGSLYYNFIVLILISYGSLLVACCGTCAGVRHFKHLQKMKINIGYKGVPVAISEQRIFDSEK